MKTIIAGSRSIQNKSFIEQAIELSKFNITEVVSGKANGVDQIGEEWAIKHHIPIKEFPALWDNINCSNVLIKTNKYEKKYNAMAGINRNKEMANYADALIAIWANYSPGTGNMIDYMKYYIKKPTCVFNLSTMQFSQFNYYELDIIL